MHLDEMVNNYGGEARTDNTCPCVLLESEWAVFNRVRKRPTVQFGKLFALEEAIYQHLSE